jgi:hypothetical protein
MIAAFEGKLARALVLASWLVFVPFTSVGAEEEAGAESSGIEDPGGDSGSAKSRPDERTRKDDVKLNEVEIRGELEKPKIFFILPKAQRDAETRERRIRFYPDILEPLDKDRFEEEARVLYQHGIPAE